MQAIDCMARAELRSSHVTGDDERFLSNFENCLLPESEWTHHAHIRVAWLCLSEDAPETALQRIRSGILRYNTEVLRRRHKYHETVTVAFARTVADRMHAGESWEQFSFRIDDILDPDAPILLNFYSAERLFSDQARLQFIEPDIRALPPFRVI